MVYNIGTETETTTHTRITIPTSNCCCDTFEIHHEEDEEYLELLCDFAEKHDKCINRNTNCALTLSQEEIDNYTIDGGLGDYICDGVNSVYFAYAIMADDVRTILR